MVISTTYGTISTYDSALTASVNITGYVAPVGADEAQLAIAITDYMVNATPSGDFTTLNNLEVTNLPS